MDEPSTQPSLREVMATFPTGVTIVAACAESGQPYGMTVNAFTSVSLDPPLILVCIGHSSTWHDRLVSASSFAVSILAADQGDTALRFASEPSAGRFEAVEWSPSRAGDPVLAGCAGWLDCSVVEVLRGGDHSILLGEVGMLGASDRPALVFHRGRLGALPE